MRQKYKIVQKGTIQELETLVNEKLDDGWFIVGPMQIGRNGVYFQTLIFEIK